MSELKPCIYAEIIELYEYCKELGINAELFQHFDGFILQFSGHRDFIQHRYSYGCHNGCVEPAIGSEQDYTAVTLDEAKALVVRHIKAVEIDQFKEEKECTM